AGALLPERARQGDARARTREEAARQAGRPQAPHRGPGGRPCSGRRQEGPVIGTLTLISAAALALSGAMAAGPALPAPAPQSITVATPRGELELPVRTDASGGPVVYASPLILALGGEVKVTGAWADVTVARRSLRLLIGGSFYVSSNKVHPMAGTVSQTGDTLFVPLDFVTTVLPTEFTGRLRWDPLSAHLIETGWVARVRPTDTRAVEMTGTPPGPSAPVERLANGLRKGHLVTVDAGHGGEDPGTRGVFLPRGIVEKHITLEVALMLREELQNRGVKVRMTRTGDTRPNLGSRAAMCGADCDLFVSLHVDALDPRRNANYRNVD